jgi:hypothetical protein
MRAKLGYDSSMKRLNSATVAVLTLAIGVLAFLGLLSSLAVAQINGVPASVSSANFGGHLNSTPGVPSSVTSLGPNGFQPDNSFFNRAGCCFNPLFPVNSNPSFFQHRRHQRDSFFPAGGAVYAVPYAVPYAVMAQPDDSAEAEREQQQEEDTRGGPTIFDRRGSGAATGSYKDSYPERGRRTEPAADATPVSPAERAEITVADQPQTVLVFKDGHRIEVQNYAVVGSMLYDLTPGRHPKIAIADLDLSATAEQNDERGISFQVPPTPKTKK